MEVSQSVSSVSQSCLILWDLMYCSMTGFPVHHPEPTQTHVYWISDAIQPFHPLLPASPLALNLSQHQSLFQRAGSLHHMPPLLQSFGVLASVLPMNIQGWFPLGLTGLISLLSSGLSRVFSSNTVQKHQFFSTQCVFNPQLNKAETGTQWD